MALWTARTEPLAAIATAVACIALFANGVAAEPRVCHADGYASKKGASETGDETPPPPPLLGTLVQTHSDERVLLDEASPSSTRFDALLADRATGATAALDPRLLRLLRTIAGRYATPDRGPPWIELVSGFRSPKLNEMLRKKGHHVASHSQHSLGHAVDFRIVVPCAGAAGGSAATALPARDFLPACAGATELALDPRAVERAIRATGWDGGTGVYTLKDDWFVHADVGPNRTWFEGPRGAETAGMGRGAQR